MKSQKGIGFKITWLVIVLEIIAVGIILIATLRIQYSSKALEQVFSTNLQSSDIMHIVQTARNSLGLVFSLLISGLIVSIVLAVFITRSITRPVKTIVSALAKGTNEITSSSEQLASTSQNIANGSQEQATGLEQSSASLETLSSMVKNTLTNTKEASNLAQLANESSTEGLEKMQEMIQSMDAISKSTDEINAVIDVIEDIAFQTNMLALNAAVEAARAGEAGLGFAVVADEVKSLANRSGESAKETAAMIKETLQNVERGTKLSSELADLFKKMADQNKKIFEINKEIEISSVQQNEDINQANSAMRALDSFVQSNVIEAKETATASEAFKDQALSIKAIVKSLEKIIDGDKKKSKQGSSKTISTKTNFVKPKMIQKAAETKAITKAPEKKSLPLNQIKEKKQEVEKNISKPAIKATLKPDIKPVTQTTTKATLKSDIKPATKPTLKPLTKPTIKPQVTNDKKQEVKRQKPSVESTKEIKEKPIHNEEKKQKQAVDKFKTKHIISFEDDEEFKPEQ